MRLLLVAVALLTFALPGAVLVKDHPSYGVVVPMPFLIKPADDLPKGDVMKMVTDELGAKAIRVDLYWSAMQPTSAPLTTWLDPRLRDAINRAHSKKLHVYVSLSQAPDWAAGNDVNGQLCGDCKPANLVAWANFVKFVLTQFSSISNDEITYGIWNEPDGGKHFTPVQYKDLFGAAHLARLAVNTNPLTNARFGLPETSEGAVNLPNDNPPSPNESWLMTMLRLTQLHIQARDVLTVHWYPGNRSQDLPVYMAKVLAEGQRETWLTEIGETKDDDNAQQETIGRMLDTFNHRPSTLWSKVFVYRLYGYDAYSLLKVGTTGASADAFRGRESFFTYHRKIRTFVINLRADNANLVFALDDGTGRVQAMASTSVLTSRRREAFVLEDLDGGALQDGDFVTIRAQGGMYFHVDGTNREVLASSGCACTDAELFIAEEAAPAPNQRFRFRSQATGKYMARATIGTLLDRLVADQTPPLLTTAPHPTSFAMTVK